MRLLRGIRQVSCRNGFKVVVTPTHDMSAHQKQHGIPRNWRAATQLSSTVTSSKDTCPPRDQEAPDRASKIKGISLPGMPDGSPGMGGVKTTPFEVLEISDGPTRVFAVE